MSNSASSSGGGIGFGGLLAILFIALKLTHVITWGWLWVLSPLWIGFLIFLACILLPIIFFGGVALALYLWAVITGK